MILRRDLQEASGGLIAAQLGPSSAPRRLNAGNHLSDLIRRGMKRAVLINADLDGRMERRMDGWMDGPPPLLHHQHQYHQRRPPRGDGGPLEYYYTSTASNQIMAACQTGSCRTDTDLT